MDEEELSWFLSFIILSIIALTLTLYQSLVIPLFEQSFSIFVFQIPAAVSLICWLYIRAKGRKASDENEVI